MEKLSDTASEENKPKATSKAAKTPLSATFSDSTRPSSNQHQKRRLPLTLHKNLTKILKRGR